MHHWLGSGLDRTTEAMQSVVDQTRPAQQYYSDQWPIYQLLVYYPGSYEVSEGKKDTYSVEAGNAELRHYLARLARRSRCFSRRIQALSNAVKLFVYCYNQRQLYRQQHPAYPAHVFQYANLA